MSVNGTEGRGGGGYVAALIKETVISNYKGYSLGVKVHVWIIAWNYKL